ncbi:MAG: beta-lactamase family protein [Acidobacteria bacterium]|nr:beta-lactamase family protein [Acidobacteriota bacterium]
MKVEPETVLVQEFLGSAVQAGVCPGCVAGWSIGTEAVVHSESAGVSHLGVNGESAGHNTWYDLASLTKPMVVTTLFLLALRRGALDLDLKVGDILSDVGPYRSASLENLLTHTAGLPGWAPLYASGHSPDQVLSAIKTLKPVGQLGRQVEYSCLGFIILGLVLEEILGVDLATAFSRLVAEPLNLTHDLAFNPPVSSCSVAGGASRPDAETQLVRNLGLDPATIPQWRPGQPDDGNARFLGGAAGNSGLFGTIRGVVLLGREYLPGGGYLLDAGETELAAECRTPSLEQARGLGWQIASSSGSSAGSMISPDSIGHVGFTGTSLWIDRQGGRVMALLSNRHHPGHRETDFHPLRRRFNALVSGACRAKQGQEHK